MFSLLHQIFIAALVGEAGKEGDLPLIFSGALVVEKF